MIKVRHMAQVCREAMHAHSGTPHWDDLNDRQRRLSTSIVNFILANPNATPEACHNAWMGQMIHEEGFSFGLSDETAKTHPNLMPYAGLAPQVQAAYAISIGIVRGLQDIGNRYINCAPQTTVEAEGVLAAADAVTPPIVLGVDLGNEIAPEATLTPVEAIPVDRSTLGELDPREQATEHEVSMEEINTSAAEPTAESQPEGFVHFTGHNQLVNEPVEIAPESGDVAPAADPATAE